jgi:enoyl-CoA hydratase
MADVRAVHLIASQRSEEPMSEIATGSDELLCQIRDGGIAHVTFNRPHARNALTFAMYDGLADVCRRADEDRSIRAMILTGAGSKAFAAGTDIAQFRTFSTPEDALGYEAHMDRVLGALEACRVPTIAAIAGACTGGGAAIAACCDLRIGTSTAKFGFPIARTLGNCLSLSNVARLSALIGPARVKDILFTARLIEANEALQIGLLQDVVENASALAARRRTRPPYRQPRPAHLAGDQSCLAPDPEPHGVGRKRRSDPDVLHEPGFSGGHGGVPDQAGAELERLLTAGSAPNAYPSSLSKVHASAGLTDSCAALSEPRRPCQ